MHYIRLAKEKDRNVSRNEDERDRTKKRLRKDKKLTFIFIYNMKFLPPNHGCSETLLWV